MSLSSKGCYEQMSSLLLPGWLLLAASPPAIPHLPPIDIITINAAVAAVAAIAVAAAGAVVIVLL